MSEHPSSESLAQLVPIKELSEANRAALAAQSTLEELTPGSRLSAAKEHDWLLYLVSGKLSLASMASAAGSMQEDSPRAKLPIFAERAGNDFAVAEAPSQVLRIDKAAFAKLLNDEHLSGYEVVADVEVSETESELFQQVYAAYQADKLELPPMPEVALRIRRMADDPDVGIPDLAKVVQTDAAVAGGIFHAANSPLFCGSAPVNNLKDAVVRLGLKTTQSIATSIAMRATFNVKSSEIKKRMHALWEHSVNVSAMSYVIARKRKGMDPERALLAGLLHDIGVVPILQFLEKSDLSPSPAQIDSAIAKLRAMVGVLVLNAWGFDAELITVVEEAEEWLRDPDPKPDYCDVVLVSQLYAAVDTPQAASLPALGDVPAVKKLELGDIDEEGHLQVLQEAEEEIASIKGMLNA